MTIASGAFPKLVWPGVKKFYGIEYNDWVKEYTYAFNKETSNKRYEEYVGYSGFGLMAVKDEGGPIQYDNARQGFTTRLENVVYGLGFTITREMFEDDLYGVIGKKRARALAKSVKDTRETVGANIYNRAFNSSYTGGDGLELCSTVHKNVAGGTWANELATAADLSEAALEQACIDIGKWTNDRGLKIALKPRCLLIPVDLEFEADRILNTTLRVDTANNDLNSIKHLGKFPDGVKVMHYFTDTDAWFIKTDCKDGPIYQERRGDEFTMDNDHDTDNAKYKATSRYVFGWDDPRGVYGSPGA